MNNANVLEKVQKGTPVIIEYSADGPAALFYPKVKGLSLPTYKMFNGREEAEKELFSLDLMLLYLQTA